MENNPILKFTRFIQKYSPSRYSLLLAIPAACLIFGFTIWNIYLFTFGFIEDEILRAKFILSGFFFLLASFIVFSYLNLIWSLIKWIIKLLFHLFIFIIIFSLNKLVWTEKAQFILQKIRGLAGRFLYPGFKNLWDVIKPTLVIGFIILWIIFYTLFVFPIMPAVTGGGQPRALSIITKSNADVVDSFGINLGDGADYQTVNVCVVHENSHYIYVLRNDRILAFDKSLIDGFVSLPGQKSVYEQSCIQQAYSWSKTGFWFSWILFKTSFGNLLREALGLPKIIFDIQFR